MANQMRRLEKLAAKMAEGSDAALAAEAVARRDAYAAKLAIRKPIACARARSTRGSAPQLDFFLRATERWFALRRRRVFQHP